MAPFSKPQITYIATGGTIASLQTGTDPGATPTLTAHDLVTSIPQLAQVAEVITSQFSQKSSPSLTIEDLLQLYDEATRAVDEGSAGVVITQGTDTIEETAFLLDLLWDKPEPVVVSGAMRNPSLPGGDGPANLLAAVQVAASPEARELGALVVLNEEIHAARFVHKSHTFSTSTFVSPGAGPLGWVCEGAPGFSLIPPRRPAFALPDREVARVALIKLGLGDDGRILPCLAELGYKGVVIESFGGGHVPDYMMDAFRDLNQQMPVVIASRTGSGQMLSSTYQFTGSEIELFGIGAISAGLLDALKARLLLTLGLSAGHSRTQLKVDFDRYGRVPHRHRSSNFTPFST